MRYFETTFDPVLGLYYLEDDEGVYIRWEEPLWDSARHFSDGMDIDTDFDKIGHPFVAFRERCWAEHAALSLNFYEAMAHIIAKDRAKIEKGRRKHAV